MSYVTFNRKKTKDEAVSLASEHPDTIYFTKESEGATSGEIIMNGVSYGGEEQEVTLKDTPAGVVDNVEYVSKGDIGAMLLTATNGLATETTAQAAKSAAEGAKSAAEAIVIPTDYARQGAVAKNLDDIKVNIPSDLAREHEYDETLNGLSTKVGEIQSAIGYAITEIDAL